MFNEEDFQLPLEKQLRLRVINAEVDGCRDLDALKTNLKSCAESLMRYQHLLTKAIEANMQNAMTEFLDTIREEIDTESNAE